MEKKDTGLHKGKKRGEYTAFKSIKQMIRQPSSKHWFKRQEALEAKSKALKNKMK